MKRWSPLLFLVLILNGCKKENDNPQWDVNILTPLFKATIGIRNLVHDTLVSVAPDGAVSIVYDNSIYSTPVDSIFKIRDTLVPKIISFGFPVTINPGTTFYPAAPQSLDFDVGSLELKFAIIKSGYARLIARNHLPTKVTYKFRIPHATISGVPFQKIHTIDEAPSGGVSVYEGLFDMTGYAVDLTGIGGSNFNSIEYTVEGQSDPGGQPALVAPNDTIADVESGFKDLIPLYVRGYLGQESVTETNQDNSGSGVIEGGMILIDSVTATLSLINKVGADAQALLTSLRSINDRTGTTVSLVAPSIVNQTINLNRATENGPPPSSVNSTSYSVQLNNSNSNLKALIENLPENYSYDLSFNLNPLGNSSGHNDFLYTDDLFSANLAVRIPLRFAANQIALVDTQDVTISDSAGIEMVKDGSFVLLADNGFPVSIELQLTFLNEQNVALDSLFIPGLIAPASLDANNRAVGKMRTTLHIPFDQSRNDLLKDSKRMALKATFSTSAYPQILQIYSDYELDLKLIGDFTLSIR